LGLQKLLLTACEIDLMKKSISVVIPNYNGRQLIEKNLPTVQEALFAINIEHEIIIVDDVSTDDSVSFIKQNFPGVIVLVNEVNRGFSPTINKGIDHASKELVFALNSDVELTKEYFFLLIKYFDDSNVFGVSGRTIGLKDEIIQEAAKFPRQKISRKIDPYNFYIKEPDNQYVPTLYLSGANALIDRIKLMQLKGFDEIYAPFYYEDLDLSIRAWRAGWKCFYEHNAICRHPASTTIKKYHVKKKVWIVSNRNKLIMHAIHLTSYSRFLWNMKTYITLFVRAITFDWKYHKAFLQFLKKKREIENSKVRNSKSGATRPIEIIMKELRDQLKNRPMTKV
jgi:GT2 family glycosyltransferase